MDLIREFIVRDIRFHRQGFLLYQAEDGIRVRVRYRGLGDVYKRQEYTKALERTTLKELGKMPP